jgi:hypothetical protein
MDFGAAPETQEHKLTAWKMTARDGHTLSFRPPMSFRLIASLALFLFLCLPIAYATKEMWRPATLALLALLALLTWLPFLSSLWGRVQLRHDGNGVLTLHTWRLIPRTARFPLADYVSIQFGAEERIHRPAHSSRDIHCWRWVVRAAVDLQNTKLHAAPLAFFLEENRERPPEQEAIPQNVTTMVGWLAQQTGMKPSGPRFLQVQSRRRDKEEISEHIKPAQIIDAQTRYESLDEMPEDLREHMEGFIEERHNLSGVDQHYVYRDEHGKEHIFDAIEDMPTEMRLYFKRRDAKK